MTGRDRVTEAIRRAFQGRGAEFTDRDGVLSVTLVVAERKGFLSRRKVTYSARFRVDEPRRTVLFSELLKESGSGLTGSGPLGEPGAGFKVQTWKTGRGPRQGMIEEQARDLAGRFQMSIDFAANRAAVEKAVAEIGYALEYHVLSV